MVNSTKTAVYSVFLFLGLGLYLAPRALALPSPHPVKTYTEGVKILENYRGQDSALNEARKIFIGIIDKHPNSPFGYLGMSRTNIIDAYQYGNHYDIQMIRQEALPFAIKALELGSSVREVHENYSLYERIFEQFYNHQKTAQEFLTLLPDHPETYFYVGDFVRDQARHTQAVEFYKKALSLNPAESLRLKILKRIGYTYLINLEDPGQAVTYYEDAAKVWGDSPDVNEYLGIAYLKLGKYKSAIERLKKSLKYVKSEYPEYHLMQAKGYLYQEEGKLEEAIKQLEEASRFGREDSALHFNLGNLYFKIANYESAYLQFKQVIDIEPGEFDAYYFAGRAAANMGQEKIAVDYYKKYLEHDNDSAEAEWIMKNSPEAAVDVVERAGE